MRNLQYAYSTNLGKCFVGDSLELIDHLDDDSVDLCFTSPPFALLRKKDYGNKEQDEYVEWLTQFAYKILPKLKETGSFVVDLGGAYERGFPVRSLYNYKVLIKFCEEVGFNLAEEFFWNNPSKLPSPIEWVNKRKIRVKDSVNTVWWFSKSKFPKSDVKKVLTPYSDRMKKLIENPEGFYKPAKRPSGHDIGKSFGNDNGGAIPSNLLNFSNSDSNSKYMKFCKVNGLKTHPARFPKKLPEFFINLLTDPNDLVVDIFGGSNTTGEVCEELNRRWYSFELDREYVAASTFRFLNDNTSNSIEFYNRVILEQSIDF
ncbi:DNA-methyltransferase [Chryseobacterium mucoviscidosis]|uniref:Methyltransferase n=1 Tax=Chryseobacterium mucoviscidosis TaxID=1945581 RepID=A0A202BR78_9FLAO|nr:site-specific DNA-methyltransferase [Chryseobacterium mucoviscidosis]OVE53979.1 site-specific DNA-methyltransferase [Chryseobacterium mucoviscidosis]